MALAAVPAAITFGNQKSHAPRDAFDYGARVARLANRTYERNLPLIQRKRVTADRSRLRAGSVAK